MGDEYVDGPLHDQKGEKTIKNNNDLKKLWRNHDFKQ